MKVFGAAQSLLFSPPSKVNNFKMVCCWAKVRIFAFFEVTNDEHKMKDSAFNRVTKDYCNSIEINL